MVPQAWVSGFVDGRPYPALVLEFGLGLGDSLAPHPGVLLTSKSLRTLRQSAQQITPREISEKSKVNTFAKPI